MRKGKAFFYRIEASEFFAETLKFKSDKELGKFIRQFAIDLVTGSSSSPYSNRVILEAMDYIGKKREAGSKGGKQKASSAKASLEHSSSTGLASSSSSSSNSNTKEEDKPLVPPPPSGEAEPAEVPEVVSFPDHVMWIANDLARHVLANNPKNRELQDGKIDGTVLRWAKDIDKMIRLDKREPREVAEVVRWCQRDQFWCHNILSGAKLREQYDKLTLKMKGATLSVVPAAKVRETRLDRNIQAVRDAAALLGIGHEEE